jgi:hypothetical protein
MSTLVGVANANHHNSDSEDDLDYVPEGEEQGVTNIGPISEMVFSNLISRS